MRVSASQRVSDFTIVYPQYKFWTYRCIFLNALSQWQVLSKLSFHSLRLSNWVSTQHLFVTNDLTSFLFPQILLRFLHMLSSSCAVHPTESIQFSSCVCSMTQQRCFSSMLLSIVFCLTGGIWDVLCSGMDDSFYYLQPRKKNKIKQTKGPEGFFVGHYQQWNYCY